MYSAFLVSTDTQDPAFHCIITRGLCPISCTRCYKMIDVALETASQKPIF